LLVDYTEIYNMGIGKEVTNEWLDGVWIKGAIQLGLTPELSMWYLYIKRQLDRL
jgi:hypothetical protein